MGAPRPRAGDVARRLAAAILMAGTLLVALVVPLAPAAAGSPVRSAATARALAPAPQAWLDSARDSASVVAPAQRGQDDADLTGAPPALGALLARPVAFFVGLTDTSTMRLAESPVARSRGRSPPPAAVPAPR